jgi:hypothetical protein
MQYGCGANHSHKSCWSCLDAREMHHVCASIVLCGGVDLTFLVYMSATLRCPRVQAALQREGVDFSLHEVITLARQWSHDGTVIPCKDVLEATSLSCHDAVSTAGSQQEDDNGHACSKGNRPAPCALPSLAPCVSR